MKIMLYGPVQHVDLVASRPRIKPVYVPPPKPPLLNIKGNVTYDFFYQSNVDTPFTERDIHQHILQTNLLVTVKDQYPFRIAFSTQQGNSSLFRNLTGARLFYHSSDFKNQLLMNARRWVVSKYKQQLDADKMKLLMDSLRMQISGVHTHYNSEAYQQKIVEAREFMFRWKRDSALGIVKPLSEKDAEYMALLEKGNRYKAEVDSLQDKYAKLKQKYDKLNAKIGAEKVQLLDVLQHSKNNKELIDALDAMNLPDTVLPRNYRTLLAIRSVGIGRAMVDYSELTAKNISITGVQLELNPSWYLAVASGSVDYTFRNFIVKEKRSPQYINLIRAGVGQKESSHIYLTYYMGKKELYGANAIPLDSAVKVDNHLMGVSLEGQWSLGRQTFITGEVAKSSLPYNIRRVHGQNNVSSMLNFSGHTNEAWSVGAETVVPRAAIKLSGMYKRMGGDFQSFSMYTTGSQQTAWTLQAEQPFFKRQLTVTGALRKNTYATFYEPAVFESNTIFKSLQVTMRIPKLPVVTLAYQPTSQLVKLGDGNFTQQIFNTLSGTAVYNYKYKSIMMNSMLMYSRFYNKQTDTSFVYYNSRNVTGSQTVFLKKFTITGQFNASLTADYNLYSNTGDVSWKALKWLEAGASLQHNYQSKYNITQYGYGMNLRFIIPYVGEISGRAEKRYMPGSAKQLVSNNTGRITYTKIF
ncbi:MAG: hypothetical protein JO154_22570 [Chitinophaga sp.]|uniref:hypothetical protein n=1 Tax=Chitinophaga sp. TaxID=1869181 RepID=UPI0025C5B6E2|nr:hypothetical protein [Chitinophaga sp.]MBV8255402.1 hypothetical protein [Chitinophaga sp.]